MGTDIMPEYIRLPTLSSDPVLSPGMIWARDVAPHIRFTPDGTTILSMDVDAHKSVVPIDHPDRSITRAKLEYPTHGISMLYLFMIGKAFIDVIDGHRHGFIITVDSFADKKIAGPQLMKAAESRFYEGFFARVGSDPRTNNYAVRIDTATSRADLRLEKVVAGTTTLLGTQAVDLLDDTIYIYGIECKATTINALRYDRWYVAGGTINFGAESIVITTTDTSHVSGPFAVRITQAGGPAALADGLLAHIFDASSPLPQPMAYFEVPIIGSGTPDDPFRPQLPEGLAVTHSALIPTDSATGKPIHPITVLRVFDDDPRQIASIQRMRGARRLSREEAIKLAKQLDDKLMDVDLVPIKKTDRNFKLKLKDYIAHRMALGVKEEQIDIKLMEQYLEEDKGW